MAHPRCGRKSRSTGEPCTQPAGPAGAPCRFHGGAAPQVKAAAARRTLDADVRRVLADMDVSVIADPLTELGKLAGQVVAYKDALARLVNDLGSIRYEDAKGAEQLRAEVAVFNVALGECRQVLVSMARLDIDRRLAAIEETKARAVVAAIDAALSHAGITGPTATEARQVAARHLRSVG
jgi:hypothetical protein